MFTPAAVLAISLATAAVAAAALETAARTAVPAHIPLLGTSETASRPVTLASLRGRVVLLNFWTLTCSNCRNAIPSLVAFDRMYRERGLTVIGIHTPEFPPYAGEHDRGNLARALQQHGIEYPNAQDNDAATWNLYRIRYWPSYVLIDPDGQIRHEGYGEFRVGDAHHRLWDRRIRALLAERTR
jgi:thiol-disulfide isomerase/thioredoxin